MTTIRMMATRPMFSAARAKFLLFVLPLPNAHTNSKMRPISGMDDKMTRHVDRGALFASAGVCATRQLDAGAAGG